MTAKQKHQDNLRKHWKEIKEKATAGEVNEAEAIMESHGLKYSTFGYLVCLEAMKNAGLDGIPYVDCKTYNGWKESGFQVKKGEKSFGKGITWVVLRNKEDDGEGYAYPKGYNLFHKSQVENIA